MPLPPPIPVDRYLVPDGPARVPAGMTRVRMPLLRGLPQEIALDAELGLVLYAPLGNAVLLRDAAPDAVVSCSEAERRPASPVEPASQRAVAVASALARAPARLVVRRAGTIVATLPLAAGLRRTVPETGDVPGARIELMVLGWAIHAGTLRGAGDFGSFVALAWRRVDRGTARFELPRLDPRVAERFQGVVQSEVGRDPAEESGQ